MDIVFVPLSINLQIHVYWIVPHTTCNSVVSFEVLTAVAMDEYCLLRCDAL
jgi:hypothetical protein